jgi:hypothetical protein
MKTSKLIKIRLSLCLSNDALYHESGGMAPHILDVSLRYHLHFPSRFTLVEIALGTK